MPTSYDYADVKCPYFVGSKRTKITCEGITDDSVILLEFFNLEKRNQHKDIFCKNHYQNCEVCRMLDEKHEDD